MVLAGIPPLAGFFGKFYVFMAAVNAGLIWLAIVGLLASVVSAVYYLRIVKVMYFDEPAENLDEGIGIEMRTIMSVAVVFVIFFIFAPGLITDPAAVAAASLTPSGTFATWSLFRSIPLETQ